MENNSTQSNIWVQWVKFIAWLQLIGCIIVSIFILQNYSTIEVPREGFALLSEKVTNWPGICAAIGLVFGSILMLAVLHIFCMIVENIVNINATTSLIHEMITGLKSDNQMSVPEAHTEK